jgi:hypothetical protein
VTVIENDAELHLPLSAADILYNFRVYAGNLASLLGEDINADEPTPAVVAGYDYFRGAKETADMLLEELDRLGGVEFI